MDPQNTRLFTGNGNLAVSTGRKDHAPEFAGKYITLDAPQSLPLAQSDSLRLLSENAAEPLVIDECQLAPSNLIALCNTTKSSGGPRAAIR
ncbi:MAG: hypothetical protein KGP28_03740 [Bdellovibrionales bacterium]|nr:hypothetical protein [Bdellovibrionales bacterium]